jgi:Asp-tRNA(Asn)/Glu-tRNA(Gln) amidotransferase A subunit family amidase
VPFDQDTMRAVAAAHSADSGAVAPVASTATSASRPLRVSLKDNFALRGVACTAGSRMLHRFVPHYSATVAEKLIRAGHNITGKTNMDEFGMGSVAHRSALLSCRAMARAEITSERLSVE